jgi:hypothetical protein
MQALRGSPRLVTAALPRILALLERSGRAWMGQPNEDLLVSLCGLVGDLYEQFPEEAEESDAARVVLERAAASPAAKVRAVSDWAARLRDSGISYYY